MGDLLEKDYARKVTCLELGPLGTHWHLPHHPVFNPHKPGKIRVVFDCSAKYRGCHSNKAGQDISSRIDHTDQ